MLCWSIFEAGRRQVGVAVPSRHAGLTSGLAPPAGEPLVTGPGASTAATKDERTALTTVLNLRLGHKGGGETWVRKEVEAPAVRPSRGNT